MDYDLEFRNPRKLEHGFRMIHAGIPYIFYLKGMRIMMFQLSGFYRMAVFQQLLSSEQVSA